MKKTDFFFLNKKTDANFSCFSGADSNSQKREESREMEEAKE